MLKNVIPTLSLLQTSRRSISVTARAQLKQIERIEDKSKKTITIQGKYLNSEQVFGNKVLNLSHEAKTPTQAVSNPARKPPTNIGPCSWCELEKRGIYVQYTDILVLRQFLKEDGSPLPRKVTGLCRKQNIKLRVLTKHAMQSGLILNLQPKLLDGSEPDTNPRNRPAHLKWNSYFDKYEIMRRTHKYL
jgi:ribosomal protein S18